MKTLPRERKTIYILLPRNLQNRKFSRSKIWYVKNFSDVNAIMENGILPSLSNKSYNIDNNIMKLKIEIVDLLNGS